MKVTALIDEELINEAKKISGAKNITESLIVALRYYIDQNKIKEVLYQIEEQEPFLFQDEFTAYGIRKINRDR